MLDAKEYFQSSQFLLLWAVFKSDKVTIDVVKIPYAPYCNPFYGILKNLTSSY